MDERFIRERFRQVGYKTSRVARDLDIDYELIKQMLHGDPVPVKGPTGPRPVDIRQLGKVGLRRFVVAVKATTQSEWPEEFASAIRNAHLRYDAGTHEVFQETRDGWNILYCQARKRAAGPRPYFTKRDID